MTNKSVLIIISGGSGSGKTTFANTLLKGIKKCYKTTLISMDWFYLPNPKHEKRNYDAPEAYNWDLLHKTLDTLQSGKKVTIPMYHFGTETYKGTKTIQPADCFIFEGILSMYNEEINKFASLKVYVDVSDDERLIRRILRDKKERGASVEKTIKMWRETVIHAHHRYVEPSKFLADISIPFNKQKPRSAEGLVDMVDEMISDSKTKKTKRGKNSK